MNALAETIRARIAQQGPIKLSDYMMEALAHPEHGYYMTRDPFGRGGDFITAPEVTQMFGELIGLWCAVSWQMMGSPETFHLVELGPGRGTLMADALRAVSQVPPFLAAAQVRLVEISPTLRAAQEQTLAGSGAEWHADISEIPDGPTIFVANEFFDALPVRQFERSAQGWCERLVDADPETGEFRLRLSLPMAMPRHLPESLLDAPEGSVVEASPTSEAVAYAVGDRIARFGGAALLIDYGHPESAVGDTIQAVKDHEFHPILADPGEADITAHVNFARLSEAAEDAGASVHGPLLQGEFLDRLGLAQRTEALLANATEDQAKEIGGAYRRLIDPDQMGTLFKVLCLAHPLMAVPPAFE